MARTDTSSHEEGSGAGSTTLQVKRASCQEDLEDLNMARTDSSSHERLLGGRNTCPSSGKPIAGHATQYNDSLQLLPHPSSADYTGAEIIEFFRSS